MDHQQRQPDDPLLPLCTFRTIHGCIQTSILVFVVAMSVIRPTSKGDEDAREYAAERGWSRFMIEFTRTTQYLTVWSILCLIVCCVVPSPPLFLIMYNLTRIVQTSVFILWHGLTLSGNMDRLIDWQSVDQQVVKRLLGWNPFRLNSTQEVVSWSILHFQHTLAPLHMWIEIYVFRACWWWGMTTRELTNELIATSIFGCSYLCWNSFCWYVRGRPAYPIQKQSKFYFVCVVLGVCVTLMCHAV